MAPSPLRTVLLCVCGSPVSSQYSRVPRDPAPREQRDPLAAERSYFGTKPESPTRTSPAAAAIASPAAAGPARNKGGADDGGDARTAWAPPADLESSAGATEKATKAARQTHISDGTSSK
ncbi:hypothetical protein MRX96_019545 [Rhipicephalus microplus]